MRLQFTRLYITHKRYQSGSQVQHTHTHTPTHTYTDELSSIFHQERGGKMLHNKNVKVF